MRNFISAGISPNKLYAIHTHAHNNWELVYYTSGSGTLTIGGEAFDFQAGDIALEPPHCPHCESSESGYSNIYLVFSDHSAAAGKPMFFHRVSSESFLQILHELYRVYHLKINNYMNIADSMLDVLYQYIISWQSKTEKNLYIERFVNILISNLSNSEFSISEALKNIPVSPDHFRRQFKRETGKTPLEYLTEIRLEYAKQLLSDRSMTVKEVAILTGFSDPFYFSRAFKRHTGKAPTNLFMKVSQAAR